MLCVSFAADFELLEFNGIGKQPRKIFYAPFQKFVSTDFLLISYSYYILTLFRMGLFGAAHGCGGGGGGWGVQKGPPT